MNTVAVYTAIEQQMLHLCSELKRVLKIKQEVTIKQAVTIKNATVDEHSFNMFQKKLSMNVC